MLLNKCLVRGGSINLNNLRNFSTSRSSLFVKERVTILGSGWAGFRLAKDLNPELYSVTLISPRNYFVFTPLLASTSVGTLEFRTVSETIRKHRPSVNFVEGSCTAIDFVGKKLKIQPNFADLDQFDVGYDRLVVAVGAKTNTFGIEGVKENCLFLKDLKDAKNIRRKVMDCFEKAAMPNATEDFKRKTLSFAVIGGGPTGVEFSAELHDLIKEDLRKLYPSLMPYVTMKLFDVAPTILGNFDQQLAEYAMNLFKREETSIKKVTEGSLILDGGKKVDFGMAVWATGVTNTDLVDKLNTKVARQSFRMVTDGKLRLLNPQNQIIDPYLYGIGDCSTIQGYPLACTAQVANQQAKYLTKYLNHPAHNKNDPQHNFQFQNQGVMAYLGNWNAIIKLNSSNQKGSNKSIRTKGHLAWFLWRSAYMTKSVSYRNKLLIPIQWFFTWCFGRDLSRF